MRDGREDRQPQVVHALEVVRLRRVGLELLDADRAGELRDERIEQAALVVGDGRPGEREHVAGVDAQRRLRALGRHADVRVGDPVPIVPVPEGDAVEGEGASDRLEELDDRGRPRKPCERLGLGPRPLPFGGAPRSEGDEAADRHRHDEEDRERQQVLALADRERVERRREVPVGEQEAGDGRAERRPDAADRGDDDDHEQVEEQDARQSELVAELLRARRSAEAGATRPRPRRLRLGRSGGWRAASRQRPCRRRARG